MWASEGYGITDGESEAQLPRTSVTSKSVINFPLLEPRETLLSPSCSGALEVTPPLAHLPLCLGLNVVACEWPGLPHRGGKRLCECCHICCTVTACDLPASLPHPMAGLPGSGPDSTDDPWTHDHGGSATSQSPFLNLCAQGLPMAKQAGASSASAH